MANTRTRHWNRIVRIGDLISSDVLSFEQKRNEVVRRLRKSSAIRDGDKGELLRELVDELAETTNGDEYDWVMDDVYDLADDGKWLWLGP